MASSTPSTTTSRGSSSTTPNCLGVRSSTATAMIRSRVISSSILQFDGGTYSIDLNGHSLVSHVLWQLKENQTAPTDVTISNGSLAMINSGVNGSEKDNPSIDLYTGTKFTLDKVNFTSDITGIFLENCEDGMSVNILNNSTVDCEGYYAIGTNASAPETAGASITVKDSVVTTVEAEDTNGDNTAIFFNVLGTVTIDNSQVSGDRHALMLRGGGAESTHKISNSTFNATGKNSKNNYLDVNWGGGNEVPLAAIVIGNRSSNYQYPTNVEFDNVTVSAPEKNSTDQTYYLVYCYQNDTTNTVTIKGTLKRAEGAAAEFINSENNL